MEKLSIYKKVDDYFNQNDKNFKKIFKKYKKKDNEILYHLKYVNNENIVEILHKNTIILKGIYDFIGMYDTHTSVWYWAWCIEFINKNLLQSSLNVKKYKSTIKNNYDTYLGNELDEIYFYIDNNSFLIPLDNVIKLIKISLFINNGTMFFKQKNKQFIEFYIITQIIQF